MALRKRSRVSAQFNMSSLTDIIFLLLIFFMLTSTVVSPNALNLKMPGRPDTPTTPSADRLDEVAVAADGNYYLNDLRIDAAALEDQLRARRGGLEYSFLIAPAPGAPIERVVVVMDMAMRLDISGVLAAEPVD